jgi:hypothetical protein
MPNVILGVVPDTSPVASGTPVTFTVHYQSTNSGPVEFRSSAPFSIEPSSAALPPSPDSIGTVKVKIAITRIDPHGPSQCDLIATFFQSRVHCLLEVS